MKPLVAWPNLGRGLVAILRGIKPGETGDIVSVLVEAGFEAIEVPLNSPDPFRSIEIARRKAPQARLIGAGTVLSVGDVDRLHGAGGNLMVSPNANPAAILHAGKLGMVAMPGVFTATEALLAASAGAPALKFFPASALGPAGIKAIMAVLPAGLEIGAVGGVGENDFPAYAAAGIRTFGLGSSLYAPGASAKDVALKARAAITGYDRIFATR